MTIGLKKEFFSNWILPPPSTDLSSQCVLLNLNLDCCSLLKATFTENFPDKVQVSVPLLQLTQRKQEILAVDTRQWQVGSGECWSRERRGRAVPYAAHDRAGVHHRGQCRRGQGRPRHTFVCVFLLPLPLVLPRASLFLDRCSSVIMSLSITSIARTRLTGVRVDGYFFIWKKSVRAQTNRKLLVSESRCTFKFCL